MTLGETTFTPKGKSQIGIQLRTISHQNSIQEAREMTTWIAYHTVHLLKHSGALDSYTVVESTSSDFVGPHFLE